ncbi:hypothetical protein CLV50_2680 [Flavobacterium lindanitolerans]|uniref:Uncharacterized protein n=1 Tax=Flavobacterium lindanitolerans TaxID=428988 RepID=A0A497U522_9FLAO|nr:hypothetical protein B0G92_2670 [Flavobacterium lindanitolerans]RLJ23965.1 hypothetical protein CLV50_2680 [Flavobacterium lindanitolerans]
MLFIIFLAFMKIIPISFILLLSKKQGVFYTKIYKILLITDTFHRIETGVKFTPFFICIDDTLFI